MRGAFAGETDGLWPSPRGGIAGIVRETGRIVHAAVRLVRTVRLSPLP